MKNKRILFIFMFAIFILLILTTKSNASQYLNKLDFYAELDENGNMNVTEIWDIDVSYTNTLYKTFELDENKYSNITNVKVSEVGRGDFSQTNTWEYHLNKNEYFGGINNDGDFEIAFGVGLDNSAATTIYKISYTVLDAVTKYNDCAELYWQFLGNDSTVDAKIITGTIKLPVTANFEEDIKVWGHVEALNGEIYATSTDTVEFNLNNYSAGNYVEVRVAMPTEMFGQVSRTYYKDMLSNIIEEETEWAEKANARRKMNEMMPKIIASIAIIISVVLMIFFLRKTIKYSKRLKEVKEVIPTQKIEYFREKPNKEATPADALFLYNGGAMFASASFGKIFSATLLNLSLRGYFKIAVEKNGKGKEETVIYKPQKDIDGLQYEEERIARFVKIAIGANEKITIKELQKYIRNNPEIISRMIKKTETSTKDKNKVAGNFNEQISKEKTKYTAFTILYFLFGIYFTIFLPISIVLIINAILTLLINRKLSNLTQKGIDEREKWKGLKKYMEDFSLLNEKEIPALEVWEEYLVYATVFGIADKVIKQLKIVYPQIEEMDSFNTTSYIYLMSHTNFNSSFSSAINSSMSSAMSSGSGGGGGFSGGGGGGRRPVAVCGGR